MKKQISDRTEPVVKELRALYQRHQQKREELSEEHLHRIEQINQIFAQKQDEHYLHITRINTLFDEKKTLLSDSTAKHIADMLRESGSDATKAIREILIEIGKYQRYKTTASGRKKDAEDPDGIHLTNMFKSQHGSEALSHLEICGLIESEKADYPYPFCYILTPLGRHVYSDLKAHGIARK